MAPEGGEEQQREEEEEEGEVGEDHDAPAHYPSAPLDELFDISTTVDPSYIISLIRKLLPMGTGIRDHCDGVVDGASRVQSSSNDHMEASGYDNENAADTVKQSACQEGEMENSCDRNRQQKISAEEEVWEEYGCVLWDLATSRTHAELMVENLILEVLLANLMVSQPVRVTEICLGIIGNLVCHEVPMKVIVSRSELIEIIMEQLFLDDTECLIEACRILASGLQGTESVTWAESLRSEHILHRILWIADNTLNPKLIEKSVGLLLAIIEGQHVGPLLLPSLMKLGLPSLLINLLSLEMGKLKNERIPERYSVLDAILHAVEALSVIDDHSQELCSNKELFQLVCELVKYPDKFEIATPCVTATILIANILSDVADLASEISQDYQFLQGLFDILPFVSSDLEARSALWSIVARLLIRVQEDHISLTSLHQYVLILANKSDLIEDDLLNGQFGESTAENDCLNTYETMSNARKAALRRIICILNKWSDPKDHLDGNQTCEWQASKVNIDRLLECCRKYTEN